jgi:hypothetical protein
MTTTTTIAPSATSARVANATNATDATIWAMYDIASFLVEAAKRESASTGFELRSFLWSEFPFSEAAMAAFVEAYRVTAEAIAFQYSVSWSTGDEELPPLTPEESAKYIQWDDKQEKAWEAFSALFLDELADQWHRNHCEGRIECEKWAVIKARRQVETDFLSVVRW